MSAVFDQKIHETLADPKLQLAIYAATGRLIEIRSGSGTNGPFFDIRFGERAWDRASREFTRHSESLTNLYVPGHGMSSFLAMAMTEVVRWQLTATMPSSAGSEQRVRALAAMRTRWIGW